MSGVARDANLENGRMVGSRACTACAAALDDRFGWCSNCQAAYCLSCGRRHYCTPSCQANGCYAGLCVRLVEGGVLSEQWGLPARVEGRD